MIRKTLIFAFIIACTIPVSAQTADMAIIPYRMGDLWGYVDAGKNILIKPEFEEADFFYEGYGKVKKGGKYGFINKGGRVLIPFRYFSATPFRFGYFMKTGKAKTAAGELNEEETVLFAGASTKADGYEICINTKGVVMPKCPAIAPGSATEINKKDAVTLVSNYSTIKKTDLFDRIVGDYKMPGAEDTYYIAVRGDKYGVFNKTFEVIVPFEYAKIEKANMGIMPYLVVEKDSLKGMMFGNGSLYMAVENSRLQIVQAGDNNNYIIFTKDGLTGLKSSRYKVLVEPLYKEIAFDKGGGFILTGADGKKGYCFLNQTVLEAKYNELESVPGGEFVLITDAEGKKGYISRNLVEYFEN